MCGDTSDLRHVSGAHIYSTGAAPGTLESADSALCGDYLPTKSSDTRADRGLIYGNGMEG